MMRTRILLVMIGLSACGGAPEGPAQRTASPLIEFDGDVPTPPGTNPEVCPSGFHACSLGVTGYDCQDTSFYYCAQDDAGCRTPAPCVPEPLDGGPDAIAAWIRAR